MRSLILNQCRDLRMMLQVCTVAVSAACVCVCTGCDSLYIRHLSLWYLMHLRV